MLIFWDWDNTLADTFGAIFAAQNALRKELGLPPFDEKEAREMMNRPGADIIRTMAVGEDFDKARAFFVAAYRRHIGSVRLMPGATEALAAAREAGCVNILASAKEQGILLAEAAATGLCFDRVCGAGLFESDKPTELFAHKAAQGFDTDRVVSVGDGMSDIFMARHFAGGRAVWVGKGSGPQKNPPDEKIENLFEIPAVLEKLIRF